jgi:hypothetical protein
MKFYSGLLVVLGSILFMGCAETTPRPVEPVGTATLSSELLPLSSHRRLPDVMMLNENPYEVDDDSEDTGKPTPMKAEDPWGPDVSGAPALRTWGSVVAIDGF